ncbi:transposase family protein [Streptomyces chartreusis]
MCWPAGSAWTAPPSPAPSARCSHCSRNGAAPSRRASAWALSPRSSSTWAPAISPGSSTVLRFVCGARPPAVRTGTFVSGETKQNAVKSMVLTDSEGRVLFCSPVRPGSCADITQARQLGLAEFLVDGPFVEIFADADYQGMGVQTGGWVVTPPHRKFNKNAPAWCVERHEQQRKAHA